MKRIGTWILLAISSATLVGGCGLTSDPALGGETHWLKQCDTSAECGAALACSCGVCTRACADDTSCRSLSDDARCAAAAATRYGSACTSDGSERLCVQAGDTMNAGGTAGNSSAEAAEPTTSASTTPTSPATTPTSAAPEPVPTCVDTADGCLSCADARQRLQDGAAEAAASAPFDTCDAYVDDCVVVVGWGGGCEQQCDIPAHNSLSDGLIALLDPLSARYCLDPSAWQRACGVAPIPACNNYDLVCRAGRCVKTPGEECADRSLYRCERDEQCVVARAFPFDAERQCFASLPVAVGCVPADVSCPPVTTAALDFNDNCFLFGGCLAAGFAQAEDTGACNAAAPTCPE